MHPIPIPALATVLDEIHTRPDTRALLAAIRAKPLLFPEQEPALEPPRPLTVADRLERARQMLAENPLLGYSAIADRCGLVSQQVRNLAFRYGLQRGAQGVHTGRTKSLAVRAAVPDRRCLNPRCGKLIPPESRSRPWRHAEALVCNHACQHAWLLWQCQVRTARENLGLMAMTQEPERWFLTSEIAEASGVSESAARHRLRRWNRMWGWVETMYLPRSRQPWWRISAAGLEGVREARQ